MHITATFSNGHADTYKGLRLIKAGWMVVSPSGEVRSGHSIDRKTAEKTARGHAAEMSGISRAFPGRQVPIHYLALQHKEAVRAGFKTNRAFEADLSERRAAFVASCKIEVVDL